MPDATVPAVAFATPPASNALPVSAPAIAAASLAPLIVTVTVFEVPSTEVTANVSVNVPPALSAWTVELLLLTLYVHTPALLMV